MANGASVPRAIQAAIPALIVHTIPSEVRTRDVSASTYWHAKQLGMHEMTEAVEFTWADPLRLGDQLSEEEQRIRDSASDFCQSSLMPRVVPEALFASRPLQYRTSGR